MNKKVLSFLFTLIGMLVGTTSAWAETVNAKIGFPAIETDVTVSEALDYKGEVGSMAIPVSNAAFYLPTTGWLRLGDGAATVTIPEAQRATSSDVVTVSFDMAWGNKSNMGSGFYLKDSEGEYIASFQMARWDAKGTNANSLNIDMTDLVGGHSGNKAVIGNATHFDITVSYAAKKITSVVTFGEKSNTFTSDLTNTKSIASFEVFGYGAGGNADRASIFNNLVISTRSSIKYSNDFSNGTVTWKTSTAGRYTPVILEEGGNKYLSVTDGERNNNGATISSSETEGKVAASENFTMSFRVKLGASNDKSKAGAIFRIYDAANSKSILELNAVEANATAWTINGGTQKATVSAGGGKAIGDLSWINIKVTSLAGGKTYLTVKDAAGEVIDGFNQTIIPTLSETGGLGKMEFPTSRYSANFAIDDILVRDVVESEDIPATPIYTYTVKYVDQDGNEFKDASVREEYEGTVIAITEDDKATVVNGKSQYTYVSNDAAADLIAAADGSTVITVTFEKTTVADYVVNYLDGDGNVLKEATTHKNAKVGSQVNATLGEVSRMLINGVFYDQVSGNEPLTVSEDETANVINLVFAPVAGITGYFYNNYEDGTTDWVAYQNGKPASGRYDPINADGSTIADRATTVRVEKVDPMTGEISTDEAGNPVYEDVPGESIPFANKSRFLTVAQGSRNNNGAVVNKASLAIEQADFTLEARILLGSSGGSNSQNGTNLIINNFAGDAAILKIAQKAEANTTNWIINDDAENFTVVLPNSGTYSGTDMSNLSNYDWYNLKVTVYNGVTFVTITDKEGTAILDKAQVPTKASTYGVGAMQFNSSRYNANLGLDDVTVRSVVESEDVPASAEFVAVKINYVDEAGTPVKTADEAKFQVGQPIVLNSAFTADFKVDAEGNVWTAESESAPVTKYIYVSDNSADVPAALNAQVNVVFRGVAPGGIAFRYQIQKADGTITSKDDAGNNLPLFYASKKAGDIVFEKDILTYYYPYYLIVDGLLYKTGDNSGGTDKGTIEVGEGTSTKTTTPVTWVPATETVPVLDEDGNPMADPETEQPITRDEQISNAVFAQETENIEGITPVKDQYTTIRMANGAAGAAIGGNVLVTTLEPGKYTLTTATRSGTTNFAVNGVVVHTIASSGTITTTTSPEFTVDQTADLVIQEQPSTTQYSDYVLIRKLESMESYEITIAEGVENGTVEVPAAAAAGAVVKPVLTPDTDFKAGAITVTTLAGTPVEVTEGAFTMPAEPVTVSATFIAKQTTKPVPAFSELADDGETIQYIYNVEAGAFLLGANDWGTRASADEAKGYQFKVQKNADGTTWTLNDYVENQSAWKAVFAENPSSVWVDNLSGANVAAWEIKALGENKYEITNPAAVADGKLAVAPSLNDSRLYLVDDSRFGTTWAFVSEADYAKYQAEYAAWLEYVPELKQSTKYGQDITPAVGRIATSMDGWTIDNESTFHINTWSWEGLTDGSWMTPSFLENWVGAGSLLPEGTWTYTISGLVPGQSYDVSALVRAYNEGSTDIPTGAYLYAGEGKSEDISTGTANVGTKASVYATLAATGAADADGNLKIGIVEKENNFNWIVARDFKVSVSIPKFEIDVAPTEHGSLDLPAKAAAGEEVVINATADEGYELASVIVTGSVSNSVIEVTTDEWTGVQSFVMPEEAVTVSAKFQEAYVKLSDYAVTVNPEFVYDPEFGDEIVATITYSSDIKGSYAESFALNAQFDYEVKDASGNVVATGSKNPLNVSDNKVTAYIDGLAENTTYTINITGVEVTDFDLATFESVVVFKEVIGLDGKPLATATFTTVKPFIAELNVERYVGQGYTSTVAEVDFSAAEEYLGVNGITSDMIRIVNPDGTTISDYAPYDGWFATDGTATTWNDLNATEPKSPGICVKFFQAINEGKYAICDMNGADVVDNTYTVRWAIEANDKVAFFNINVKFVEQPVIYLADYTQEGETVDVNIYANTGNVTFDGADSEAFQESAVSTLIGEDWEDVYGVGAKVDNKETMTDNYSCDPAPGFWCLADGTADQWANGTFGVSLIWDDSFSTFNFRAWTKGDISDVLSTTFYLVNNNTKKYVAYRVILNTVPTGIDATPAADGVKPDGKYFENGKIVIYKNGNKYDVSGAPLNK